MQIQRVAGLWIICIVIGFMGRVQAANTTYYEVWRNTNTASLVAASRIAKWHQSTSFVDKELPPGVPAYYWVRAVSCDTPTITGQGKGSLEFRCPNMTKRNPGWLSPVYFSFNWEYEKFVGIEPSETYALRGSIKESSWGPDRTVLVLPDDGQSAYTNRAFGDGLVIYSGTADMLIHGLASDSSGDPMKIYAELDCRQVNPNPDWWTVRFQVGPDLQVAVRDTLPAGPTVSAASGSAGVSLGWTPRDGVSTEFSESVSALRLPLPVILTPPQSQWVSEGSNAQLSVYATNLYPLTYQWFKDGTALSGQIDTNLSLLNVVSNNAGGYWVTVANSAGSVTSVVATLTITPTNSPQADVQNGLVAYYPFDGSASDVFGSNNPVYVGPYTAWTADRFGRTNSALAGNTLIDYGDNPTLGFATSSFSVCFWVLPQSTSYILGKTDRYALWSQWAFQREGGGVVFFLSDGDGTNDVYLGGDAPSGVWCHICAVVSRETQLTTIYTNGWPAGQASIRGIGSIANSAAMRIGYRGDWYTFDGAMDDLRMYDRALTAGEVAALAGIEHARTPTLTVNPLDLTNSTTLFQKPGDQSFQIQNTNGGTLSYAVHTDVPWLSVSPVSGSSSGEANTVVLHYQTLALSVGDYVGHITVTAPGASNSPQSVTVYLSVSEDTSLGAALNAPGFAWISIGDAQWGGQSLVSHDGAASARSGSIGDNQQSSLEASVNGPGILRWWWKASSETGFDFVRFYLDGQSQFGISDERDWEQRSMFIPAGAHTIRWSYVKDGAVSKGQDAVWVDEVTFEPSAGLSILSAPQPLTNYVGGGAIFSVTARGESPISYQWRHQQNGTTYVFPGETNASLVFTNLILADSSYYFVTVSNTAGATNVGASLTVLPAPPFQISTNVPIGVTNGLFLFRLSSPAGAEKVVVEGSFDLITWTPVYTNFTPTPEIDFADRFVTNLVRRYYRATAFW